MPIGIQRIVAGRDVPCACCSSVGNSELRNIIAMIDPEAVIFITIGRKHKRVIDNARSVVKASAVPLEASDERKAFIGRKTETVISLYFNMLSERREGKGITI